MADVQHKRGTRSDLNILAAANGLLVGQVYFITDEDRLSIATSVSAYQAAAKEGEGGSLELYAENPSSPTAPSATGSNAVAIGSGAVSSGFSSFSIGQGADATADQAIALGLNAQSTAVKAVSIFGDAGSTLSTAIGQNSTGLQAKTRTGAAAMALGGSYASGTDSFAAAIANNASSYGATGANSIAVGQLAKATGTNAVAIGSGSTSSQEKSFSVMGGTASGQYSMAFNNYSVSSGQKSISLGWLTDATGISSVAIGTGTQSSGLHSVSLGQAYASGADSFAAAIANSTSSYGATGANSVAMGYLAKASASKSTSVGGDTSLASGGGSFAAGGEFPTASGAFAVALGGSVNTASGEASYAYGKRSLADKVGKYAYGAQLVGTSGATQAGMMVLVAATSDATPKSLASNTNAAGTTNQIILPNNSAYSFSGTIIARQDAASGSNYASWEIKGALLRDANAASTVLGNGIINKLFATAGATAWDIALTADTTNGGLAITATGAAAVNIRWVATVNTSEVSF